MFNFNMSMKRDKIIKNTLKNFNSKKVYLKEFFVSLKMFLKVKKDFSGKFLCILCVKDYFS